MMIKRCRYLDAFFIVDPADHLHTHLSDLTEGWLLQTDVSENLDYPLSYTDTGVLYIKNDLSYYKSKYIYCSVKYYTKNKLFQIK